jgi:hypothetical protein
MRIGFIGAGVVAQTISKHALAVRTLYRARGS